MVGRSPAMQEVFKRIALAAASEAPMLLSGESGTGKELAARAIHRYSRRAKGRLWPSTWRRSARRWPRANCSATSAARSPAPTSTARDCSRRPSGGTLFLDEVADIPLPTQVKLLRALEHGEVMPVGGNQPVPTDFRLVSATHQDLAERVDGRLVSARSLFPAGCVPNRSAAAARARARTSPRWPSYFVDLSASRTRQRRGGPHARSIGRVGAAPMVRQRPRAAQRHRACRDPGPRSVDHAGTSAAAGDARHCPPRSIVARTSRWRPPCGLGRTELGAGPAGGSCVRAAAGSDRATVIECGDRAASGPMRSRGPHFGPPSYDAPQETHPTRGR